MQRKVKLIVQKRLWDAGTDTPWGYRTLECLEKNTQTSHVPAKAERFEGIYLKKGNFVKMNVPLVQHIHIFTTIVIALEHAGVLKRKPKKKKAGSVKFGVFCFN